MSMEVAEHPGHLPRAQHLAGSLNATADELSRWHLTDHERQWHPEGMQGIFQEWGEPCSIFCNR